VSEPAILSLGDGILALSNISEGLRYNIYDYLKEAGVSILA